MAACRPPGGHDNESHAIPREKEAAIRRLRTVVHVNFDPMPGERLDFFPRHAGIITSALYRTFKYALC